MSTITLEQEAVDRAVGFHRSLCPGLALGIKAAQIAVNELGEWPENIVAVVESDICAVDGVQAVTGCTIGNRNLIVKDYGKNVYTFWRRSDGKAIRIHGEPAWNPAYQALRKKVSSGNATPAEIELLELSTESEAKRILDADPYTLFEVHPIAAPVPETSTVDPWITCPICHEQVMETRACQLDGQAVCQPCFETAQAAAA